METEDCKVKEKFIKTKHLSINDTFQMYSELCQGGRVFEEPSKFVESESKET